jgi:hypothetical protein
VLNCKGLLCSNVLGIRVHTYILQGSLKCSETLALQKCVHGGGAVRWTIDPVLHPDFLQVLDQVDPVLWGSSLEHLHKLLVGSRPSSRLAWTGLQLEVDELQFVLVLVGMTSGSKRNTNWSGKGLSFPRGRRSWFS